MKGVWHMNNPRIDYRELVLLIVAVGAVLLVGLWGVSR